jgi:adenine-specific DNA glycosylase
LLSYGKQSDKYTHTYTHIHIHTHICTHEREREREREREENIMYVHLNTLKQASILKMKYSLQSRKYILTANFKS